MTTAAENRAMLQKKHILRSNMFLATCFVCGLFLIAKGLLDIYDISPREASGIIIHDTDEPNTPSAALNEYADEVLSPNGIEDRIITVDDIYDQIVDDMIENETPLEQKQIIANPLFVHVKVGDTLAGLLQEVGLSRDDSNNVVYAVNKVFDVRDLRAGQEIKIEFDNKKLPHTLVAERLKFYTSVDSYIEAVRKENGEYEAADKKLKLTEKTYKAMFEIENSFYGSAIKAGLTPNILQGLIKMLSYDIDFQRDLRKGDNFELLFSVFENEKGKIVKSGAVHYAKLSGKRKNVEIYRYTKDGVDKYYKPDGSDVRKSLLRTPIDGARLSSGFGKRRHPVLGYTKMHKGLDFAASTGTPVFAAGDGKVTARKWLGSYGNYIKIRHNGTYSTAYAHLSKFKKGLKTGDPVKQGQVIGYIGSTGRSTGPHLHYEVMKGGRQVNPLSISLPVGDKLSGKSLKGLKAVVARVKKEYEGAKRL